MDTVSNKQDTEMELQGITILWVMKVAGLLMLVTKVKDFDVDGEVVFRLGNHDQSRPWFDLQPR